MHTDVVKKQNNEKSTQQGALRTIIDFRDHSRRLQVIVDAHEKELN